MRGSCVGSALCACACVSTSVCSHIHFISLGLSCVDSIGARVENMDCSRYVLPLQDATVAPSVPQLHPGVYQCEENRSYLWSERRGLCLIRVVLDLDNVKVNMKHGCSMDQKRCAVLFIDNLLMGSHFRQQGCCPPEPSLCPWTIVDCAFLEAHTVVLDILKGTVVVAIIVVLQNYMNGKAKATHPSRHWRQL